RNVRRDAGRAGAAEFTARWARLTIRERSTGCGSAQSCVGLCAAVINKTLPTRIVKDSSGKRILEYVELVTLEIPSNLKGMLSLGPKNIIIKLERIPVIGLRSGGGDTSVKQDVIRARDSHLGRVECWEYTESFTGRSGIVWDGPGWASLSNAVKPEARRVDYVRGEGMSLRNRREGVAGRRVDSRVVVVI